MLLIDKFIKKDGRQPKWEYVTFDLAGAELLFQLLATRYENMSTIITSNLGFSDWVKVFHDRTLAAAILDRITHHALILNINGKSFRRR